MELAGKMIAYLELQSSHDYFFKVFGREAHKIPGKATNHLNQVDLHEGDWETSGAIKQWVYTIDGKKEVFKEKIHIDEANKTITLFGVGGHPLEQYKAYNCTFAFAPKLLTLTIDYEKYKAEDPRPNHYMDVVIRFLRDIDAHLLTN